LRSVIHFTSWEKESVHYHQSVNYPKGYTSVVQSSPPLLCPRENISIVRCIPRPL